MNKACIIFLLWSICSGQVLAQDNLLKRKISYQCNDQQLERTLLQISDLASFTFSYDASILPRENQITLNSQNESVKTVLDQILPQNIDYKTNGNHLILLKTSAGDEKEKYTIKGKIYNSETKAPLSNVVVYEVNGLISAASDVNGAFLLSVPAKYEQMALSMSKHSFIDTVVFIPPKNQEIRIYLSPEKSYISTDKIKSITPNQSTQPDQIESLPIVQRFVSDEMLVRSENMGGIVKKRPAQVSFIPTWGTNLEMSGQVDNNISLNVLVGYAHGVDGFEVGGLLNIIRRDVNGVQAGGIGNLVGHNTIGAQVGGVFNHNRGSLKGVQVSGVSNFLIDTLVGVQISGVSNLHKGSMKGWQISGVNNVVTQNVDGLQLAGVSNISMGNVQLAQIAGVVNHGKNVEGAQIAGVVNHASKDIGGFQLAGVANKGNNVNAAQIAGVANIALDTVSGVQLSGVFNYTKYTKSTQLGLINYADSTEGVPIGFLSIVRKGFHTVELSTNEITYINLAFKTGVKKFYNIFSGGYGDWYGGTRWSLGYGLGTEKSLGKNTFINLEYKSNWVSESKQLQEDLSLLNRFDISFGYKKPNQFGFTIGPSINFWSSEWTDPETGEFLTKLAPYTIAEEKIGTTLHQMWVGGKLAVYW